MTLVAALWFGWRRRHMVTAGLVDRLVRGGSTGSGTTYRGTPSLCQRRYDLGYFDDATCRLEPIDNPFGPNVLPMCPE